MHARTMNRRQAIRALAMGGAATATIPAWVSVLGNVAEARAQQAAGSAPTDAWSPTVLSPRQHEAVTTLAELIIPKTDTAGATDANVNQFIDTVLEDAPDAERTQFLGGLRWLDDRSRQVFGANFVSATAQQQRALLTIVAAPENESPSDRTGVEFFQAMKQLTVTGYYTSQAGMAEELDDDGRMAFADDEGCVHPEHQG